MLPDAIKILAVDDDPTFIQYLSVLFTEEVQGFHFQPAFSGQEALQMLQNTQPALILLDIRMPGMDGYVVCKKIRELSRVPVIMLTNMHEDEDKIAGFQAGADDYIVKLTPPEELIARVKAVLNRCYHPLDSHSPIQSFFNYHGLIIDFNRGEATLNGEKVELTATEYKLLSYLARHANQLVYSADIIKEVWGESDIQDSHTLQVNIGRLRRKLEAPQGKMYIETRPGLGYIFNN